MDNFPFLLPDFRTKILHTIPSPSQPHSQKEHGQTETYPYNKSKVKVKISLFQAVEAHRVARG
jgi:hypothetical protein